MFDKSLQKGTFWTIIFFLASFAKTIILTPLMLVHWGADVFCFWAIIISARALVLFLSDGFVRYVANQYNLLFHTDEQKAQGILRAGVSFLLLFSAGLCVLVTALVTLVPGLTERIFDATQQELSDNSLALCLCAYLFAACAQNVQRLYAATKESRGLVWHNMVLEVLLIGAELSVMSLLLWQGAGFSEILLADSGLILVIAVLYCVHLFMCYPLPQLLQKENITLGAKSFLQAGKLYASNFFEKLSTDGLVLLLSFFRFDKAAIALFATIRTIANTPLLAQNLLLNTYTPQLQKDFALRNELGLRKLFMLVRLRIPLVLLAGILCCYPLYEPVFVYWTKGTIVYDETFMVAMLVMTTFSLYGLGYSFVLKGLNLLPQMLGLMILKTALIVAGFYLARHNIADVGIVLADVEFLVSVFFLPFVLYLFWQKQQLHFSLGKNMLGLVLYLLTAFILLLFLL